MRLMSLMNLMSPASEPTGRTERMRRMTRAEWANPTRRMTRTPRRKRTRTTKGWRPGQAPVQATFRAPARRGPRAWRTPARVVPAAALALAATASAFAGGYSLDTMLRGLARVSFVEDEFRGEGEKLEPDAAVLLRGEHRAIFERAEFTAEQRLWVDRDGRAYHRVPYAYLEAFPFGIVSGRIGKHRVPWGTAYGYSPTDVFHPGPETQALSFSEDGLGPDGGALPGQGARVEGELGDFGMPEEGALGATLFYDPSLLLSISAGAAVDDALRAAGERPVQEGLRTGVRVATYPGRLELIALGVYKYERFARLGAAGSAPLPGVDVTLVGEAAAELDSAYVYPDLDADEPTLARVEEPRFLATLGAERGFSGARLDFDLTLEYLYAGVGYTKDEADTLREWAGAAALGFGSNGETAGEDGGADGADEPDADGGDGGGSGESSNTEWASRLEVDSDRIPHIPPFLGRHYAHGQARLDIGGYVELTTGIIANLVDPSGLFEHRLTVKAVDAWDLFLAGRWAAYRNREEAELTIAGLSGPTGEPRLERFPLQEPRPARAQVDLGVEIRF